MLKAVLFDMDGVIVNSEPLHRKAYKKMFLEFGMEVSDSMYESFTGKSTLSICQTLCNTFSLSFTPEILMAAKRHHYKTLFENDLALELIDGVFHCIQEYYEKGLNLVLASSASMNNINSVFDRFDLDRYFKAKLSGADLAASKPHPEIFIKAAQAAGYERQECMVIEDSTNGIQAAHAAGIYCVAYQSPASYNQDYRLANYIIRDFKEIAFERISSFFPDH